MLGACSAISQLHSVKAYHAGIQVCLSELKESQKYLGILSSQRQPLTKVREVRVVVKILQLSGPHRAQLQVTT